MTKRYPARRGGLAAFAAAGLLFLAGCAPGNSGAADAPAASAASAAGSSAASESGATSGAVTPAPAPPPSSVPQPVPAAPAAEQRPPVLPASAPVTLTIAAIGVRTDLLHLGLRDNGSLQVPQDTGNGAPAGWYSGSPTPGERGPSVMLGHVNALGGHTGVFANLRKLKKGDEVSVSRTDGSTAVFTVDRGAAYSKNDFPTLEVYGNTAGSELRLITCDGYDSATGLFDDNYVIYATLKV